MSKAKPKTLYLRRVVQEEIMIVIKDGETPKQAVARVLKFGRAQVPWIHLDETIWHQGPTEKVTLDYIPPVQHAGWAGVPPYNPTHTLPQQRRALCN